ncbi:ABC transporter permease [Halobiforma lacisalsi AJ5]|uniref:ABC transporter permease n=1 Tax=Natronobacterium lacisalsi AJ5 TaxID=358396 RepID=M0LFS1_NATLA|nr:FtsX-like permease family protein [Halobiforma lacisalsi]APW99027.1 ABC transporter permease [Halobiforma lacisalsi AJ5]EMA31289.1 hypothetical protein C445_14574 [Halobiforma lacisalsi AJ5]
MSDDRGGRGSRWLGVVGFSLDRLWKRATRTRSGRVAATTAAVAMTIALLVIVTGIALALADGGVATETDADVRVAPEDTGSLTAVDGVEGPRLGEANQRAETIAAADGVDHATPMLVEKVRLEAANGSDANGAVSEPRTILVIGVVPDEEPRTVAGLSTGALEPGDLHYAGGTYAGAQRGEIVLSATAADRLGVTDGDRLEPAGLDPAEIADADAADADSRPAPTVTVTAVEDAGSDAPVALAPLSEVQTVSGASDGELADRVLVWGDDETAAAVAGEAYPEAAVETDAGTDPSSLFDDGLAFATSALALVVGVTICASFVATTTGMTVDQDRRTLAVLESVGFPTGSRLAIVALSTVVTTLCGALLGAALGFLGIEAVNAVAASTVAGASSSGAVAQTHPLLFPYAVVVGLASGLIAVPYPLAIAHRTTVLEEVGR